MRGATLHMHGRPIHGSPYLHTLDKFQNSRSIRIVYLLHSVLTPNVHGMLPTGLSLRAGIRVRRLVLADVPVSRNCPLSDGMH